MYLQIKLRLLGKYNLLLKMQIFNIILANFQFFWIIKINKWLEWFLQQTQDLEKIWESTRKAKLMKLTKLNLRLRKNKEEREKSMRLRKFNGNHYFSNKLIILISSKITCSISMEKNLWSGSWKITKETEKATGREGHKEIGQTCQIFLAHLINHDLHYLL